MTKASKESSRHDASVRGSSAAPAIAGLVVGIGFIILLSAALNPPFSRFLTNVTSEEQVLMGKARQHEAVQLFLKKYPFAKEGVLNREPFVEYDDGGNITSLKPAITVGFHTTWPRTIITYEDVKVNNLLVRYEYPSLWVVMGLDGDIYNIKLRCGISYLESSGGMVGLVMGNDVLEFLRSGIMPC